jgi:hypothetical protein
MPVSLATSSASGSGVRYSVYQCSHSLMAMQASGMGSVMLAGAAHAELCASSSASANLSRR